MATWTVGEGESIWEIAERSLGMQTPGRQFSDAEVGNEMVRIISLNMPKLNVKKMPGTPGPADILYVGQVLDLGGIQPSDAAKRGAASARGVRDDGTSGRGVRDNSDIRGVRDNGASGGGVRDNSDIRGIRDNGASGGPPFATRPTAQPVNGSGASGRGMTNPAAARAVRDNGASGLGVRDMSGVRAQNSFDNGASGGPPFATRPTAQPVNGSGASGRGMTNPAAARGVRDNGASGLGVRDMSGVRAQNSRDNGASGGPPFAMRPAARPVNGSGASGRGMTNPAAARGVRDNGASGATRPKNRQQPQ